MPTEKPWNGDRPLTIVTPKLADWKCRLFGTDMQYHPTVGNVPNAWWRFWQWVFFGHRWERLK